MFHLCYLPHCYLVRLFSSIVVIWIQNLNNTSSHSKNCYCWVARDIPNINFLEITKFSFIIHIAILVSILVTRALASVSVVGDNCEGDIPDNNYSQKRICPDLKTIVDGWIRYTRGFDITGGYH
jgi:hypothetical protein